MTDLAQQMAAGTFNIGQVANVRAATARVVSHKATRVAEVPDWEARRQRAHAIKTHTLARLDHYLWRLKQQLTARGAQVHFAEDAAEARRIILEIAKSHGVRKVVKSKSMAGEEIGLNQALSDAGIQPVETDLGEYIVQLRDEPPAHIIAPAMHLSRDQIGELFADKLGADKSADAQTLTAIARKALRADFTSATMGFSGVNFAVAETGTLVIVENEGNARLSTGMPNLHVALMGIEKVLPRMGDLALFLGLLIRSATGQKMTSYVQHFSGSPDRELHLVLLDNGRTKVLAQPERRELLACVRCGACLNVCPVYRAVGGGHPYGWTYSGPIGAALAPMMGPGAAHPRASSLCGACSEACPIGIQLHRHLLDQRAQFPPGRAKRRAMRLFAWLMTNPRRYRLAGQLLRRLLPLARLLGLTRGWTAHRALPSLPRRTFSQQWRARK